MNKKINIILKILVTLISVVALYFFADIIMIGDEGIIAGEGEGIVGAFVYYAIALLIGVTGITVLFSVVGLIKKPEVLKKTFMSIAFFTAVIGISYSVADDSAVKDVIGQVIEGGEQGANSKWVSTGIWTTLILGAVAILSILLGGIRTAIK